MAFKEEDWDIEEGGAGVSSEEGLRVPLFRLDGDIGVEVVCSGIIGTLVGRCGIIWRCG